MNNNFRFSKYQTWGDFLIIKSDNLENIIKFVIANKVRNIELNPQLGFVQKELSCIKEIAPFIEGLSIVVSDLNLDGIESFTNLKKLYISDGKKFPINFSNFTKLESCNIVWDTKYASLSECHQLKELILRKFNNKIEEYNIFQSLINLEHLDCTQTNLTSLGFLRDLPKLKTFEISYAPKLLDIDGLTYCKKTLTKLEIDHCKRIGNYEALYSLPNLERLLISDSKEIPTIDFVSKMRKLQHFSFVGTTITSGDLSLCAGLKHVGFDNKKHYSHTYEELKRINGTE